MLLDVVAPLFLVGELVPLDEALRIVDELVGGVSGEGVGIEAVTYEHRLPVFRLRFAARNVRFDVERMRIEVN